MAKVLTNDFSWSKSRHEKFSECLRAYYLYYYRSWGGWDRSAPQDIRELYLLKKLHNRYTWAGGVVHDSIKQALLGYRAGRNVDGDAIIARAHQQMQHDYRHSASKAYRQTKLRKEFSGLMEHEYDLPVTAEEWKANWETARSALAWFFGSHWPDTAKALRKEQWLEVDEGIDYSSFHVDGVKVFAIPDFAYLDDNGHPIVVDWKTGRAREGYDDQVLGYVLYLATRYRYDVDRIKAALVYLNDGVEHQVGVDSAAIAGFKQRMSESVDRMRALLADPAGNAPHSEASFPMTEDPAACARCVFRRVCGRDGVQVQVA